MTDPPLFGALVVPRDPDHPAVPAGEGATVGIVAEARRADCRVLCPRTGRSYWIAPRALRRAHPSEGGPLETAVGELLALLRAREMELDRSAEGRWRLAASHGTVTAETIDRVRGLLGGRLSGYAIRPQGMHRLQTVLEFTEA